MTIYDVAIIPLIVGLIELLKQVGLPAKFGALTSAVLGIIIGIVFISPDDIKKGVLVGLSLGLAASGLFSGIKNTVEGTKIFLMPRTKIKR